MSQVVPATDEASEDDGPHFERRNSPADRLRNLLHRYPAVSPALVLVLAVLVFGLISPRFWLGSNLSLVTQQVAVVGTLAVAQTLIILTAGIDLSVGAVMVLASMVVAQMATGAGLPGPVAIIIGVLVGMLSGALNGLLVTRVRLPPFIVTLGSLNIFLALTLLYSHGETVRGRDMPGLLTATGQTFSLGNVRVSTGVLLMLAIYVIVAYVLGRTAWGRHVMAVGDDAEAARLAGISVNKVLMSVYISAGAIVGLAAWVLIGRANAASPNAGLDLNLDSITAVVIGGTSLFGGRGSVWGTLLGALIVGVFRNGLALAGLDVPFQNLSVGILIIVAVSVDQWIRKAK